MALHLVDKVAEFLTNNPNQKFTAREIAQWIYNTYPDACKAKQKKSKAKIIILDNKDALIQQLVAEINASRARIEKKASNLRKGVQGNIILLAKAIMKRLKRPKKKTI
ncbi:hypothetical protein [Bartonella sp. HY406]|uniref:hypothetical protein n=1 Tax=Bartonella sp. HY406 TaxID=2979331 RepID=UPI0021C83C59|nr:hypothetical protein [Bartonella sp. HY406]UXN02256.1 hypothetical protein N6B01_07025 [Bartonella sp. HY406]